ncbi:MAG: galactose mutarotase [Clostridia bacterium]|nr:galactose mutarotase [Clostridia bacterium]
MSVQGKEFGRTADGRTVTVYRITNKNGAYVDVLDYGCTLQSICVPNRDGTLTDVCLGYDTVTEYEENDGYLGAFVGRHANRIGKGEFVLNGQAYSLAVNNGPNHLHGGLKGFDKVIWSACVASDRLIFSHTSPDGDEGYPANLMMSVTYCFDDSNTLTLIYDAVSDGDTVVNFTNHCYFNLNGQGTGTATDHLLQVNADAFTENDGDCLPTGKILSVEGTPFDFRTSKPIGRDIGADDENLKNGSGYDHNFVLQGEGLREVAVLSSEKTGIVMTTRTTQPGVQVYTANFLTYRGGKNGTRYSVRDGVCLETQHFPDALHHENFPSVVLKQGEEYHQITQYAFTVKEENEV